MCANKGEDMDLLSSKFSRDMHSVWTKSELVKQDETVLYKIIKGYFNMGLAGSRASFTCFFHVLLSRASFTCAELV
jgi:hypothetical protein